MAQLLVLSHNERDTVQNSIAVSYTPITSQAKLNIWNIWNSDIIFHTSLKKGPEVGQNVFKAKLTKAPAVSFFFRNTKIISLSYLTSP